jgi:hypothetical protein
METTETPKKTLVRSKAYPALNMENCIELTKKIHAHFANVYANREQIAAFLEISESHLVPQVSACSQYDLLELKHGEGYKASEAFIKIKNPLSEEEKKSALTHCLLNPPLYKELVQQYQNNLLPSVGGLATFLCRNGIAEKVSNKVASIFFDNLKYLNLISQDNKLMLIENTVIEVESVDKELKDTSISKESNILIQTGRDESKGKDYTPFKDISEEQLHIPVIFNKSGRKAVITVPADIDDSEWDKIARIANAQKINE